MSLQTYELIPMLDIKFNILKNVGNQTGKQASIACKIINKYINK